MKTRGQSLLRLVVLPLFLGIGLLAVSAVPAYAASTPVPYLFQSLSPDHGVPGSTSPLALTLYGTGFVAGTSTISFVVPGSTTCTGALKNVNVVSSREMTATVPVVCLATAATAWVSVKNGNLFSNVVFFPISNPTAIAFSPSKQGPIPVPDEPLAVVTADFNKDGKLDLAVASAMPAIGTSGGSVTVLLGNGDGTFQTPVSYPTGIPYQLAVGDFNGDGNLDIAGANEATVPGSDSTIFLLLGQGNGQFTQAAPIAAGGTDPFSIVAGDFNCDGKLDLATANNLQTAGEGVTLLPGNGDGTFQPPISLNECTRAARGAICLNPVSAVAGDFDNDGILDLAVLEWSQGSPQVAMLRGSCSSGLTPNTVFASGLPTDMMQFALGNFSGHSDGTLDMAFIGNGTPSGSAGILIGQGTLTRKGAFSGFKPPTAQCPSCTTSAFPNGLAVGDFNADNFLDVAVATGNFPAGSQPGTGVITTLAGAGNGTFNLQSTTGRYSGSMSDGIAVGDFNNDGKLDLAVTNYSSNTVTILLHQ